MRPSAFYTLVFVFFLNVMDVRQFKTRCVCVCECVYIPADVVEAPCVEVVL